MMKVLFLILHMLDPRKIIACYTIFLVVRAVETEDIVESEDVLLLTDFCPNHVDCDLSLSHTMDVSAEFEFLNEDKPPLWTKESNPILEDVNVSYLDISINEKGLHLDEMSKWWGTVFVPKPVPNSKCEHQVELYLRDLKRFELWAMQMWDATAKPAAGLLSGNSNQLGDFDACLTVGSNLGALQVQGRYCLADVDLETTEGSLPSIRAAVMRLQAGAFVRSKHSDPGHFAPRWTTLHWGLCVPAACSSAEVEAGLKLFLLSHQLQGVTVDAVVKPGMCYTGHRYHHLPFRTLVTLGFFGGILMMAVVSTMVDNVSDYPNTKNLKNRDRALLAFSLRRTWEALVTPSTDELPVIHGVRSVFTVMLFAAHKLMPLALTPYSNRTLLTQCSHSVFSAILRASSVFTDSFLLLSGVLAAYNLSREMQKNGSISWQKRILARVVRLTPALLAVVLFYAYVMEHLSSGPQWTSSVTANADLCKAHLWKNVLYVQNFFMFEEMCAPHTHQLALDMQLFLLAPLVVYCLHRWLKQSLCALVIFQLCVACLRYFTFLHYHLSDFIYHNISLTDLYRNANLSYSQAIHRAIPYTVGLLVGFFLQKMPHIRFSYTQTAAGWALCAVLACLSVFYPSHLARPDAVYDVYDGAGYAAISPVMWSSALAWLIVACSLGHGGWLQRVLCQHWLVVLSRLSYSIYLTQFIIFFYYVGSVRSSQEFSLFYVIGVYEVIFVLLTSLLLTLLFDLPMQEIKTILLPNKKSSKSDKAL